MTTIDKSQYSSYSFFLRGENETESCPNVAQVPVKLTVNHSILKNLETNSGRETIWQMILMKLCQKESCIYGDPQEEGLKSIVGHQNVFMAKKM